MIEHNPGKLCGINNKPWANKKHLWYSIILFEIETQNHDARATNIHRINQKRETSAG